MKRQALEDKLREAQCTNVMVKFTLHKELVKEFMAHEFFSDPLEANMLDGFMPFCIQKMEKKSEYTLMGWEKHYDTSMHTIASDYDKKEAFLKIQPVMDAMGFISVILNTRALAWALFMSTSPLTQDLQDLYEIVLDGYQTGELEVAGKMQPNWYAHSLWMLYKDISKFFMHHLMEENLQQGIQLKNPLTFYIQETSRFKACYASGVPSALMGSTGQPQVQSNNEMFSEDAMENVKTKEEAERTKMAQRNKSNKMGKEISGGITKMLIHH